jgi:hypothetical protein
MSVFDLLFLVLALITLTTLAVAAALALGRRTGQSLRILRRLAFGALVYFAVVIAVSFVAPRRVFSLGEDQCFDDWCVAATSFGSRATSYLVDLRISSRARRISQRELNLAVYLTDRANHRYDPTSQPSDIPFSTLLAPGQSVHITRHFSLPASARDLNLVIRHEGGFPIGWFIIGYDTWFRKPPLVLLTPSLSP